MGENENTSRIKHRTSSVEEKSDGPNPSPELRHLPGGEWILAAQRAAGDLLARLPSMETGPGGILEGWHEVARRGKLPNLLLTEHLHDDFEFLRRHLDGEQLYLSRESSVVGADRGLLCWELTSAALGAPRRTAIGLTLASKQFWRMRGVSFHLLVNARQVFTLSSESEVEELLSVPPAPARIPAARWRQGFLEVLGELGFDQNVRVYQLSCDPEPPEPEDLPGDAVFGRRDCGLFVAEGRRLRYLEPSGGAEKSWREISSEPVDVAGRAS